MNPPKAWRRTLVACALVAAGSLLYGQVKSDTQATEDRGVNRCRSLIAAQLFDAMASQQAVMGELVVAIPERDEALINRRIVELDAASDELKVASERRLAFEANPTGDC